MLLDFGKIPDLTYIIENMAPAFYILIFIIAASFFIERFFCRYLCPLGAIFSIVSRLRVTRIVKPKAGCGKCRICTDNCPMGIDLYQSDFSKSGECINCFECLSVCPRKNVRFAAVSNDISPMLAGALAVTFMSGVYYVGTAQVSSSVPNFSQSGSSNIQSGVSSQSYNIYPDGTYTGTGTGFRGTAITVSCTIKSGRIARLT